MALVPFQIQKVLRHTYDLLMIILLFILTFTLPASTQQFGQKPTEVFNLPEMRYCKQPQMAQIPVGFPMVFSSARN